MILSEKVYAMSQQPLEELIDLELKFNALDSNDLSQPSPQLNQSGMSAVIDVTGALFQRPNFFTMLGFGVSLLDVQYQLNEAQANSSIKKIILNFDSPGGSVVGINELANIIKETKKPVTAYVRGSATSAAFWLAAACDQIICDDTAMLGSIGVVGCFKKNSESTIEIVSSHAPNKRPDVESIEGKRILLQTINDIESVFIASLIRLRPSLSEDNIKSLKGGVLIGVNAVNHGFADGVGSLQGVIDGKPVQKQMEHQQAPGTKAIDNGWNASFLQASKSILPTKKAPTIKKTETIDSKGNDGWALALSRAKGNI